MSILFVASEIFPYAKTGGLADVAYALPQALREKKQKVYSVMPLYNQIDRKKYNIEYTSLTFDYYLNGIRHQFDIFHRKDSPNEYFIYNPILCNRLGLYYDSHGDFGDNSLRFGLFSYATIELMLHLKWDIKAIHINDWQTSLIALLIKTKYQLPIKVVLTIHNLAYQGIFDKSAMLELELDWNKCFKFNGLEYYDFVNFLKAGIFFSDVVTTVSKSYAKEIQTSKYANSLEETLHINNYKLKGILNGISTEVFNPKKDEYVDFNFSVKKYKFKKKNKIALLKELDLKNEEKPLFIFIGRFTSQKGVDLILESINLFKSYEANLVILGDGESFYNEAFNNLKNKYKNIYVEVGYNEALSRKLYASADFLIMPSTFEPCGLNQMICMRFGVLPIVSRTGGLKDTVSDFTDIKSLENTNGIGITFEEHNLFWFNHALAKALSLYSNKDKLIEFSKHNMQVDNSWSNLIKEYLNIYYN